MLELLSSFIIHLIQTAGYLGVALLMTLEACFIPIPSEVTLPFAGFLAQQGKFVLPLMITAGVIGDVLGFMIAYAIGYYLEETVILNLIHKYGKFILFSKHEYETVMKWFQRHGNLVITIAKLLPGFRTIIGLPAGLSEVKPFKALGYALLGSVIWCSAFVYLGYSLGAKWNSLEPVFRKFELVIGLVILVLVVFYVMKKFDLIGKKKS